MAEHDGLPAALILVENFGAVLGGDRRHACDSFNAASRIISWLMGIPRENSLCSGLDDAIDEFSIVHAPLAKPSDRLP